MPMYLNSGPGLERKAWAAEAWAAEGHQLGDLLLQGSVELRRTLSGAGT